MLSKSFRVARRLVPLALIAVAGCDDSTGPNGGLSGTQQQQLMNLFGNTAFTSALLGGGGEAAIATAFIGSAAALGLESIGSIQINASGTPTLIAPNGARQSLSLPVRKLGGTPNGTYQAFGAQLVATVGTGEDAEHVVWTGIIGVNSLSNPTDIITVGVFQENTSEAPSSIESMSFSEEEGGAAANYILINGQTSTLWHAISGQTTITSASFSGASTSCLNNDSPTVTVCNYTSGTIGGNFDFSANRVSGTDGNETITVPSTTVSVPAVRLRLTMNPISQCGNNVTNRC